MIGILIAPVFLLAALWLFTVHQTRQSEKSYPPQGAFVNVDGLRIHYLRKGEGRPVVLLHGIFGSLYDYTASIFDRLAQEYDVTAVDLPGSGHSKRPPRPMQLSDHVRYLRGTLRQLGLSKPVLVAHSWGAASALGLVVEHPEEISGLVLLSGYVTPWDGPLERIFTLPAVPMLGEIFLNFLLTPVGLLKAAGRAREVFWPDPVPEGYLRLSTALTLRPGQFRANAEDVRNLAAGLHRLVPRYGTIRCPLLILTGDSDRVTLPERHAQRLHQAVPHSELVVFERTGHKIAFTRPEEALNAVRLACARCNI